MICQRCGDRFTQEDADRVSDCFDADGCFPDHICFTCAEELWREREQEQGMSDVVQDGPAA